MKSGKKNHLFLTCCVLVSILLCCSVPLDATQTTIWNLSSYEEFQQGELNGVSLTGTGEVFLAPHTETIFTLPDQSLFVWALARDSKGNVYVGTGEQGRIFKISPDGTSAIFFDSPEIAILSLAVDVDDNVYAGSAPDGLVYKLTPEGSQTTFFSTEEAYVWSLTFDDHGTLYAGTGKDGKIFQILPDGTGTVLYDSPQTHIMSLVYDIGGWLYAGTEGKGITYKVGLDGSVFALYDAKEQEIRSLTLDSQGNLYIAAISSEFYAQVPAAAAPMEPQEPRPKENGTKISSIYCIHPSGTVRKIVELPEVLIYTMITDANDHLLVGADEKGQLFRVFPEDGTYQQVLMLETGSIVTLLPDVAEGVYIGTSDKGAVHYLAPQLAEQGMYLSPVHDAKTVATWGKIFWRGDSNQITIVTRTGNTAVPDDTWSPWSEELHNKEGMPIPNPAARFIQWKAILSASQEGQVPPALEEVSVAYLPHNLPPEVEQVAVFHPTPEDQSSQNNSSGNSQPTPARQPDSRQQKEEVAPPKQIPPGYIAVIWKATDPNGERMQYTLEIRGEQETKWKMVKEELEGPLYFIDPSTLPDGGYYVKVTATDVPDNPPNQALTGEKVSERFEIDNTAPEISIAFNQKQDSDIVLITVIATDEFSRLHKAEYSLDGEDWTAIFPDDAVTDSRDEKYSISLSELTQEEHLLVFRAIDIHSNAGVAKFVFSPEQAAVPAPQEEQTPQPEEEEKPAE